jgi:hypothetical protein
MTHAGGSIANEGTTLPSACTLVSSPGLSLVSRPPWRPPNRKGSLSS